MTAVPLLTEARPAKCARDFVARWAYDRCIPPETAADLGLLADEAVSMMCRSGSPAAVSLEWEDLDHVTLTVDAIDHADPGSMSGKVEAVVKLFEALSISWSEETSPSGGSRLWFRVRATITT